MAKKKDNFDSIHIASRDNTSVGSIGFNENISELQPIAPQIDMTSIISGFVPVVSDVQDVIDMKDALMNKDPLGMALASFGLLPFVGGFFTNANKIRKIKASYKDLLRLSEEPDVSKILKDQYHYTDIKSGLKELAKDEDKVDELYKRVLQGRYQFYRGDANISGHDITQIAPYNTSRVERGIGAGRHNVEDIKDTGLGVLYTTNNPTEAAKFASVRKPGEGWVPTLEGGMGVVRIKDADFTGGRLDWLKNNPIPDESFGIRKIDNTDGSSHYIFIGKPNESVGQASYLPKEEVQKMANDKTRLIKDGTVAAWAGGGTVGEPEGDDWTSEDIGNPVYSKQSHRAVDQKARDERFANELAQEKNDRFENVVVPLAETAVDFTPVVGDLKSVYDALLYTKEGNHAMAALAAMGVFPGIPGISRAKKIFSKKGERVVKALQKNTVELRDIQDLAHIDKRIKNMMEMVDAEGGMNQARKFSEMFPILPWDIMKANKVAGEAAREGVNYVEEYYKNPTVKAKVQKILGDNGYNMPEARRAILKEKGVIDESGRVDVDKYIDMFPHEVGDLGYSFDGDIEGFHFPLEDGGRTVTSDRNFLYMRDPRRVSSTAAHEQNHTMQEVLGFDSMSIKNDEVGYYTANPDHTIGRMFQEVANKNPKNEWFGSPSELHSVLMEYKKIKGVAPDAVIDDRMLDKILEIGVLNHFFDVTEANKPKIKKLLNALPAAIPVAGAAAVGSTMSSDGESYAAGGVVGNVDNYDIAFDYLTKERKLKPEQAVAIMSNLQGESNMDPSIENSIGAYGVQQWLGPRKKELFKKYGSKPTLLQQLEFLVDEHEGKIKGAGWNYINKGKNMGTDRFNYYMYSRSDFDNAPSVADAIIAWNQGFGRPATFELNNERRLKAGMELASRFGVDFGDNTYGQMGLGDAYDLNKLIIDKNTIQPESLRDVISENEDGPTPPLSNGVASYVPSKNKSDGTTKKTTSEDGEEKESEYAKKLRQKVEEVSKKKKQDQAKLDFFNTVWNSISLRSRN